VSQQGNVGYQEATSDRFHNGRVSLALQFTMLIGFLFLRRNADWLAFFRRNADWLAFM
jgi:hypothetical protein